MLIELFREALKQLWAGTSGLGDIIIERAREHLSPPLIVELSDGHCVSAPVRSVDFCGFCEKHSTLDLAILRRALLREA